jgi:hypothetical protein
MRNDLHHKVSLEMQSKRQEPVAIKWLNELPTCSLQQARKLVSQGASLHVHLDEFSTKRNTIWRFTIQDGNGQHWAPISVKSKEPRQLESVRRVY